MAERLTTELAPYFHASHRYHLRIAVRRKCAKDSVTKPHALVARGTILSHLKLIYLFFHYWTTYLLITLPRIIAGHLVLFDRYFHDHSIDPLRYRLSHSSVGFAEFLSRAVPQPDLQLVLDVPAAELQRRKGEVSFEESNRQRRAYIEKLASTANGVVTNASLPISAVTQESLTAIFRYMKHRDLESHK